MRFPRLNARRGRLGAALLAVGLSAVAAATAQAAVITQCTKANVVAAAASGGSHSFACDGRIVLPITVSNTVSFDADGHDVKFAGPRSGYDTAGYLDARGIDGRVIKVAAGGSLTLRGIVVEDGLIVTPTGAAGRNGTRGADGAAGVYPGGNGGNGGAGQSDATAGAPAAPARGGCILVEEGGALVLRDVTLRRCQAASGRAGAAGVLGGGGSAGDGAGGAPGREESAGVEASDGGRGGSGGSPGSSAPAVVGVDNANGEGGAIHSAGTLDVVGAVFEDNLARGGDGGQGGDGAHAGAGGKGGGGGRYGCYSCYGRQSRGGDGGAAGAPGRSQPGADGGDAGAGHGGAVWARGSSSISGARFARNVAAGGKAGWAGDGGSGGQALFGEAAGCVITSSGLSCDPDKTGERGAPAAGTPGADGGAAGSGGDAIGGAVFFGDRQPRPVNTTNDANRVVPGIGATTCSAERYDLLCAYGGSGGQHLTHECIPRHETDRTVRQPCRRAADAVKGQPGRDGAGADADVGSDLADGLSVTVSYPGDDVPYYRLPLEEPVTATVKVAVAASAPGAITDIAFAESAILRETENDRLRLSGTDPPAPFTLPPGGSRSFEVVVNGESRGATALRSGVEGEDALRRTATAAVREVVEIGQDIKVKVTSDPDDLTLDGTLDEQTQRPPTKPVSLTVELENVADEDITAVVLDLKTTVRQITARNPSAPYPLQIKARLGEAGAPETPLTNDQARELVVGALADGEKKTLRFRAEAADKAIVDVRATASGTAAGPRTVLGLDEATVRIGQPALLALTATGQLSGTATAGAPWSYSGHIENLSPDEDVTVLIRADRRGNVVEGQLDVLGDPDACGCGVFRRLEPGERLPIYGTLRGRADGTGAATIDLEVTGRRHTYDSEGAPVAVPVAPSEVLVAPGADHRQVSFFFFEPVTPPISVGGVAWLVSDSAARAFGDRVTGAQASVASAIASAKTFAETPKSVYLQWALNVIRVEAPEAYDRALAEMTQTLLAFDDQLDSGEALDIARQAYGDGIVAGEQAWQDATWQDLSSATGTLLGTTAPDLALEAVLPAIGACKLFKYGGKTAMLRRAEKLGASRAGRLLAKGRKGLIPGDEISSLLARKLWGVDGLIDSQLMAYAKAKNVIIAVRDRSPGSIRRLAEGLLPKWEKVKAKNVSQLDIDFLGFHESHLDTAMLKQMPDESTIRARIAGKDRDTQELVLERWRQRQKEWDGKDRAEMEAYEQGGKIPAPTKEVGLNPTDNGAPNAENVWVDHDFQLTRAGAGDLAATTDGLPAYQPRAKANGQFRAMTGDMDPIAVLDENGQIPSLERRLEIYRELAEMGFQHPESLTWDNAAGRAKYLRDFDLANGEADALLAYAPDGTRRAVYFDSRKSRLEDASKGFMALVGTNIAFDAAGIVEGQVPVIPPAEASPPVYFTPGGSDGAILSDAPGARLIRRNLDGTFSEWTREGGWKPYTLPGGQTLTTLPQTSVRSAAAAGETRIDINEQDALILKPGAQSWFVPGDVVVLDPGGPNEEFVTVAALGSIITTEPLKRAHVSGEMVAVVPRPAPGASDPPTTTPQPSTTGAPAAPPSRPAATPKRAAPRLLAVKLATKAFKGKAGTRLSFSLDRAATVAVLLQRKAAGRRQGRTCSAKAKKGKRCSLLVAAGARSISAKAGTTKVAFGKGLKRGSYTATLVAGGSAPATLHFTVR